MDAVFSFFKGIVDLGAAVMLPIVLIIIGLFFRMKLGQAIKSGLMVGIGFQGLFNQLLNIIRQWVADLQQQT